MFADDGIPFRIKMLAYIEREFADDLGSRRGLLCSESVLDWLTQQINRELSQPRSQVAA